MNRLTSTAAPALIGILAISFAGSAGAIPLSSGSLALRAGNAPATQPVQWRGVGWRGGWGGWRGGWGGWRGGWGFGRWDGGLAAGALLGGAIVAAPYATPYAAPYYGDDYGYGYDAANCDCSAPSYSGYYYPSYYGSYGSYGYSPYRGGYWPGYRREFFYNR